MTANDAPAQVAAGTPARASEEVSQTARAFLGVRELLLRGEFERGERIAEIPLAARLGVSRTPIRMALERLAHLGLLDANATGGFVVREFTIDEVRDAIEVRAVLEGTAARLAAERLGSDAELEPLRGWRDAVAKHSPLTISSFGDYMDANEAFHSAIVTLAKSRILRRMLDQANSLPFAAPSAMVFPTSMLAVANETLATALVQHRGIVDAIENGEGTRAEHLAREHALLAWRAFQLALSDEDALRRVPGGPLINVSST
jgi:GntR family transcriptional regulator, vanillate catabolism transcriptional regulator